jgi:hypothetical protein
MDELLIHVFVEYYALPKDESILNGLVLATDYPQFGLSDTPNEGLMLHLEDLNSSSAKFSNLRSRYVKIYNYEKFIDRQPHVFQRNRSRVDFLLIDTTLRNFILGELKTGSPDNKTRKKAKEQLLNSLSDLAAIDQDLLHRFQLKRCCYFNKQVLAPVGINAIDAFNRLPNIISEGFRKDWPAIQKYGFEYWEYQGNQMLKLI